MARESNQTGASALTQGAVLSDTRIATHLVESYRQTDCQVHGPVPFALNFGQPSEPLLQLYKQHRCDCAAFITACNPYSQKLDPVVNEQRHLDLMADLGSRSFMVPVGPLQCQSYFGSAARGWSATAAKRAASAAASLTEEDVNRMVHQAG